MWQLDRETPEEPLVPLRSDRCRLIDLGKWLSEDYRIPVKPEEDEDGEGFLADRNGVEDLDED